MKTYIISFYVVLIGVSGCNQYSNRQEQNDRHADTLEIKSDPTTAVSGFNLH
ncbi:hypothetical protein [Sphingobacterium tabacisoli]|uniref:Uncharacterized protein n=1 Tax=Sphingobacterium tabacisoli TaxID=2044855 RepID=A0ABW5L625_9SPHI|nr:hypothetical protein [Sphingobacterium tabacisoli]